MFFSRSNKVYLLKDKNETLDKFFLYKARVENKLSRKIKRVRYDRGEEYISFNNFCEK